MADHLPPDELDPDWVAFAARDRGADGRFVAAVTTTGIYCRPSCPARRPRRGSVRFFADGAAARAEGFRACRRCRPDESARDVVAVETAARLIEADGTATLAELGQAAGYAPYHLHRLFTRALGVTPAAYARARRSTAAADELRSGSVTEAVYAAGYSGPSRFYADAAPRLGMAPAAASRGAPGELIRWTRVVTSLGPLLVAATERGLCRVAFDEDEAALAARFPAARLEAGDHALAARAAQVVALVERPGTADGALPLDIRGTAFQERVWQALAAIAPGETLSYRDLAARAGNAGAVRAAGSACGANPVAVVVPCHRARRTDGSPGGYAWGLDRKQALLDRERRND